MSVEKYIGSVWRISTEQLRLRKHLIKEVVKADLVWLKAYEREGAVEIGAFATVIERLDSLKETYIHAKTILNFRGNSSQDIVTSKRKPGRPRKYSI